MSIKVNNWMPNYFICNNIKSFNKHSSLALKIVAIATAIFAGFMPLVYKYFLPVASSTILPFSISTILPFSIGGSLLFLFFEAMIFGAQFRKLGITKDL